MVQQICATRKLQSPRVPAINLARGAQILTEDFGCYLHTTPPGSKPAKPSGIMASDSLPFSCARVGILWKNYLNTSNDDRGLDDDGDHNNYNDNDDDMGSSPPFVGASKVIASF